MWEQQVCDLNSLSMHTTFSVLHVCLEQRHASQAERKAEHWAHTDTAKHLYYCHLINDNNSSRTGAAVGPWCAAIMPKLVSILRINPHIRPRSSQDQYDEYEGNCETAVVVTAKSEILSWYYITTTFLKRCVNCWLVGYMYSYGCCSAVFESLVVPVVISQYYHWHQNVIDVDDSSR
jgi:hypothetical protein